MAYSYKNNSNKNAYAKPEVIKVPRAIRDWSNLQLAIFDKAANTNSNIHICSFAGTSKTTTIVECGFRIKEKNPNTTILYSAFNNNIAEELSAKIPNGCDAKTFHQIGLASLRAAFPNIVVDPTDKKLKNSINQFLHPEAESNLFPIVFKIVKLAKGYLSSEDQDILDIITNHNIEVEEDCITRVVSVVWNILEDTLNNTRICDFDDMIAMPLWHNLSFKKYKNVFIDEGQDLNKAQRTMIIRCIDREGRAITAFDRYQAIYSWRGSDTESVNNLIKQLPGIEMPLSVSYRCAKKIILEANKYVTEIQAAPNAKDGEVINLSADKILEAAKPGCFIISRLNAPLVKLCLKFWANRVPASIRGRDFGSSLTSLIKKSKKQDVIEFIEWLKDWQDKECFKLEQLDKDTSVINDKVECLLVLSEGCNKVFEIIDVAEKLFSDSDDSKKIYLMSAFRGKGLEANEAFVLSSTFRPESSQEEKNLIYVAVTRAINKLYLVSGKI